MDNTVGSLPILNRNDPVTTEAKSRNSLNSKSYYTPTSLGKESRNIPEYISGYVDGEGCFTVTFNQKAKALLGWGYIRRDYHDKTVKFEIRDHNDLVNKVIPHFERFPLLSAKDKDFRLFKQICKMIDEEKHLLKDGYSQILDLAYQMNGSGKRRRKKEEIVNSLGLKKMI